ncbi:MAG: bifunctional diaminohydroxyphosphoribosylaminopyrimidine deaminase/5-amino-6-(5-phosphoribosylamino)uracil reductase RibD [Methylovirgula sp.]
MDEKDDDTRFMTAALNLARRGLGRTAPNPAVGALIVKDGTLIARGWTGDGGRPHAETIALERAGDASRGATLYVTLEPCSHHGRTPPCADAIIAGGIARVVSTFDDPDPRVSGRGHARLRDAGIEVCTGVLADAATRLNLGHVLQATKNRPMITLKLAETADGFAAGAPGAPRLRITGEEANAAVQMQRALHDAILIGAGTALADDPLLTVRLQGMETLNPLRIVLDSNLRLSPTSRLAATAGAHPTLLVASETAPDEAASRLLDCGVEIIRVAAGADGRIDLASALAALAKRGLTRIFCEGGPHLAAALLKENFADEVMLLTSAKNLAAQRLPALDPENRARLEDKADYELVEDRMIGTDRLRRYERRL